MQEALAKSLPGFRFSPTEQELVGFYLKLAAVGKDIGVDLIGTVDLYKHDPWELPELAKMGGREWYFFVPRDRKYPNGSRPNRVTKSGYWKATGTDRPVMSAEEENGCIGLKKTLVFYEGKAPRGVKTPWIMNEFRMHDLDVEKFKNDITLCRIYRKGTVRALGGYFQVDETKTPPSPPEEIPSIEKKEEQGYIPTSIAGQEQKNSLSLGTSSKSGEIGNYHECKQVPNDGNSMMQSPAAPDNDFMFYGYGYEDLGASPEAREDPRGPEASDCINNISNADDSSSSHQFSSKYCLVARLGIDQDFDWHSLRRT